VLSSLGHIEKPYFIKAFSLEKEDDNINTKGRRHIKAAKVRNI
jgi:hypothetical protein